MTGTRNRTTATPARRVADALINAIACPNDDDHFAVQLQAGRTATIHLRFLHGLGDLDMRLFNSNGTQVAVSQSITDEVITYTPATSGTYYVRVYGFEGAKNRYRLSVTTPICPPDDTFEPNDSIGQAAPLALETTVGAIACPSNSDFFAVGLTAGREATINLGFSHFFGDLDMRLRDASGTELAAGESLTDNERIVFTPSTSGTYYVQVHGFPFATARNRYTLSQPRSPRADAVWYAWRARPGRDGVARGR